tara:strand:- start:2063 stop:2263 length:201 start_codon:yes stop_codon:yes gene_type:complete
MRKICKACLSKKLEKFFSIDNSREDGLSVMCKSCSSAYRKKLRNRHKAESQTICQEKASNFYVTFD